MIAAAVTGRRCAGRAEAAMADRGRISFSAIRCTIVASAFPHSGLGHQGLRIRSPRWKRLDSMPWCAVSRLPGSTNPGYERFRLVPGGIAGIGRSWRGIEELGRIVATVFWSLRLDSALHGSIAWPVRIALSGRERVRMRCSARLVL